MTNTINISNSEFRELPFLDNDGYKETFQKGWSLPSVYNFAEIKDVYLALEQWDNDNFELNNFFSYCKSINLPYSKTRWEKRRILEHINALKIFSLLDSNEKIIEPVFSNSSIGSPASKEDMKVFRSIFFHYFRFKEIFSWFLGHPQNENNLDLISNIAEQEVIEESIPLYSFSDKSRFTDSFFYELKDNTTVYNIDKSNEDMMRFWDVFIKWGTTLRIIEKFSLRNLQIRTTSNKQIACSYVISDQETDINLIEFIKQHYSGNYIYIPELVFKLAITFRQSISMIQNLIIEQYKINKEYLSFERTSEIFIKKQDIRDGEKILFPKYKDAYISHLIVRT